MEEWRSGGVEEWRAQKSPRASESQRKIISRSQTEVNEQDFKAIE